LEGNAVRRAVVVQGSPEAALFKEVRVNDDRLGAYSDHEGDAEGPTAYIWSLGYEAFRDHCRRAIKAHETAIVTMKKLQELNETRRPAR
jgi:hypothetical protein